MPVLVLVVVQLAHSSVLFDLLGLILVLLVHRSDSGGPAQLEVGVQTTAQFRHVPNLQAAVIG